MALRVVRIMRSALVICCRKNNNNIFPKLPGLDLTLSLSMQVLCSNTERVSRATKHDNSQCHPARNAKMLPWPLIPLHFTSVISESSLKVVGSPRLVVA